MFVLGDFTTADTLYLPFDTYDSNGASVTITGLAVTDIEIYKDGSITQRVSDSGYVLLDGDGIDFDGAVGLHGFSVDLSDTTGGVFFVDGSQYWLNVNAITVDGQTVRFTYFFTIGRLLKPTAAGRTLTVESDGVGHADVKEWLGVAATAGVGGRPAVDAEAMSGSLTTTANLQMAFAEPGDGGEGWGNLIQKTEITNYSSNTSFRLSAGPSDDDALNGCLIVVKDQTTAAQKAVGVILDYAGGTKTVTLKADPNPNFTFANDDDVFILAADQLVQGTITVDEWESQSQADPTGFHVNVMEWLSTACATPTVAGVPEVDVSHLAGFVIQQSSGYIGINWAQIRNPTSAANLSGTTVGSVTGAVGSVTGHTNQTGDNFTRIGVAGVGLSNIPLPATGLDLILKSSTFALAIADAIWDEVLTGSTHNIATSAGRRLRQVEAASVHASGVIATVTDGHTFTLDGGAVATADYYIGDRLQIIEGTGAGQSRLIVAYTSGKVCTLDSDFTTNPNTASLYDVVAADVHVSLSDADLASGFVATYTNTTTITLDSAAVATTDYYKDHVIIFTHGTGAGQSRQITAYTSGRVCTLTPALTTALDTTTTWHIAANAGLAAINLPNQTMDITGNLSGSVGSVTGAVGSVAGNVDGSVASVVTQTGFSLANGSIVAATFAADALSGVLEDAGLVLQTTTIASLTSQTEFTLTAGPTDDDSLIGCIAVVEDVSTATQKAVGIVLKYTGSSKTVFLVNDPGIFTMANGDKIRILPRPKGWVSFGSPVYGIVGSTSLTTTTMSSDLGTAEPTNDHYNGTVCIWLSGVLQDTRTGVTDYVGVNGVLTFTQVTEAPSSGDIFVLL